MKHYEMKGPKFEDPKMQQLFSEVIRTDELLTENTIHGALNKRTLLAVQKARQEFIDYVEEKLEPGWRVE